MHVTAAQVAEDLARELARDRAHADRARRDSGLGADALGDRERAVEAAAEERADRAARARGLERVLDLAEHLRFAEHHRIEARCDAERVPHGVGARALVEHRLDRDGRRALREVCAGRARGGAGVGSDAVDLDAIARRHDERLGERRAREDRAKLVSEAVAGDGQLLPDLDRCSAVRQPDDEDLGGHQGPRALARST